jgi:hypothetical protein
MVKFTKLPDLLEPHEYYKLCREDTGYSIREVSEMTNIAETTLTSWESHGVESESKRRKWREALLFMCENRRKACSRHVARLTTMQLEDAK